MKSNAQINNRQRVFRPLKVVACLSSCVAASCLVVSVASAAWLPELSEGARDTIRRAALDRMQTQSDQDQTGQAQADPAQTNKARANTANNRGIASLKSGASGATDTPSRDHPLGVQVLFIEAKAEKKSANNGSKAEVFMFDYGNMQATLEVVDAESGDLISRRSLNSVQLPLNDAEAAYATQLLSRNTTFFDNVTREYEEQFNTALQDQAEIDMKVSIWVPDARVFADHACLTSRCALVSVFTSNHYNFSIEPVIDLASGQIYLDSMQ